MAKAKTAKTKKAVAKSTGPTSQEVKKVLALRRQGKKWDEITAEMNKPRGFILAVRKAMKEADPSSVRPSYDRSAARAARNGKAAPKSAAKTTKTSKPKTSKKSRKSAPKVKASVEA
jgi:hypothetical protein